MRLWLARARREPGAPRHLDGLLHLPQLEHHGEAGGCHAAHQHRGVVPGLQAAEDVVPEAGRPDRGRQGRDADGPDDAFA